MSHIDKKNNQESKKIGQKTKKALNEVKVETADEIGVSKEAKKNRKR